MPAIISPNQIVFIPKGCISDSVMLSQALCASHGSVYWHH